MDPLQPLPNPASRPRWGIGGMPDPPEGLRRGQMMSNADIAGAGYLPPSPPLRAPAGGAEVGGVRYGGGEILPPASTVILVGRTYSFTDDEGNVLYRRAKIPLPAGATADQVRAAWERFQRRWEEFYERMLEWE